MRRSITPFIPRHFLNVRQRSRFVSTSSDLKTVCELSRQAFLTYRRTPVLVVGKFLKLVGENLEALRGRIVDVGTNETNLSQERLHGELSRTIKQLNMFAELVESASWLDARLDNSIRSCNMPLGPVAVWGASNFPLAFSTAGGDTASALAARCPVVYKLHPAHPKTTMLAYEAIDASLRYHQLDPNIFQVVAGDNQVSADLVKQPLIQAAAFTGSKRVGTLLYSLATQRDNPIPFYGEMGSVNPVFIFDSALENGADEIASGFVKSMTLGCGQFCTNPGLVFICASPERRQYFTEKVIEHLKSVSPSRMLTSNIASQYAADSLALNHSSGISLLFEHSDHSQSSDSSVSDYGAPRLYSTTLPEFLNQSGPFQNEIFGPASLFVFCDSLEELASVPRVLEGQLTATFHASEKDLSPDFTHFFNEIELKVGRLIWNGWPTGVEVNYSMQHGGPWPATTNASFTSVGARSILRWVRPICYQGVPEALLPLAIQADNPKRINRIIDGKLTVV